MLSTPCIAKTVTLPPMARRGAISTAAVIALAVVLYCAFASFRLGSFDLAADEGRFGISGNNILLDYHQLATVSEGPLGNAGTKPYFYPLTLAMSIASLGRTEVAVRSVNGIVLLLAAFLLYETTRILLCDRTAALLTFVFFLLNPGTVTYARAALPEPLTLCCGCAALWAAARWTRNGQPVWAMLSGVLLGLGVLTKIWLVLPFVLACTTVFILPFWRKEDHRRLLSAGLWLVSFILISASHMLLVVLLTPADLTHWANLYFGVTLNSRFAGAGYDPAMWFRPWWFYAAAVFKATFFGLPLLFLGCISLARRRDLKLMLFILALVAPLILFSVMRIKQASYIFPAYPGLMLLLALGCLRLYRDLRRSEVALSCLASMAAALFFFENSVVTARELAPILSLYFVFLAAASASLQPQLPLVRNALLAASFAAMLLASAVAVRGTLQHHTGYREIASFFHSQLERRGTREVSFIAPEFPSMEFYTFRRGEYWQTFYFDRSDEAFLTDLKRGAQIFYVVDPSGTLYGGRPSPGKIVALAKYAKDVTPEIERFAKRKLPVQVFVPVTQEYPPAAANETRE